MNPLWQPIQWFIDVFNLVIDFEIVPGITLGAISLGFLSIVLIFRMIIFPLTGGTISSALTTAYDNSSFKKNRDAEKSYQRYKASRDRQNYHATRYKNERK